MTRSKPTLLITILRNKCFLVLLAAVVEESKFSSHTRACLGLVIRTALKTLWGAVAPKEADRQVDREHRNSKWPQV